MSIKNAPTPFQIIKKGVVGTAMKNVKKKAVEGLSNAFSYPARKKAKEQIKSANAYANNLKYVRERKGMPDSGSESDANGNPDELFRARVSTPVLKQDYEMQYAKRMNPKYPTR